MLSNKVSEIMTTSLMTTAGSRPVFEVMEKMVAEDVGRIVVTDKDIPVGIFTEKDVLKRFVKQLGPKTNTNSKGINSPNRAGR